jgi:hypothetical protein
VGQTLTYRTITVAAFGVIVLAPESVVHPSFRGHAHRIGMGDAEMSAGEAR